VPRKRFEWSDHLCTKYCKVHYYWDFDTENHRPLPTSYNILMQAGWMNQMVFCGPPAYYPKKPTPDQWEDMRRECPHIQMDLTCNTCRRHTFHALPV
jgi:hypothetical protein